MVTILSWNIENLAPSLAEGASAQIAQIATHLGSQRAGEQVQERDCPRISLAPATRA
jgi:methylmalonyl-CoA mutase N-terminal domain/subunit